jgi:hypothetical protein
MSELGVSHIFPSEWEYTIRFKHWGLNSVMEHCSTIGEWKKFWNTIWRFVADLPYVFPLEGISARIGKWLS